jgi:hypothetical protein
MLALSTAIKSRLQALPALAGWAVRLGHEAGERKTVPAVDVRCSGADVTSSRSTAAQLAPVWQVTLVVRRSDEAAEQIDAALSGVIASLHNWQPGQVGGRGWERLTLTRVTEPVFADEGFAGYELGFTTAATYPGQT